MQILRGLAASVGIAIGPALLYAPDNSRLSTASSSVGERSAASPDAAAEFQRVERALEQAAEQLKSVYEKSLAEVGEETAAIFLAHQEFLSDPALLAEVKRQIEAQRLVAESAVEAAFEGYARQLEALGDEYYRERALDLRDVSRRVLRILAGAEEQATLSELSSPVVIVARDLTPSDTAQMNKAMVLGFCTATGGLTSHTAIIARILGIPAVVGIGDDLLHIQPKTTLIVNGQEGCVLVEPDAVVLEQQARLRDELVEKQTKSKEAAHKPAATSDGHRVEVVANIADASSANVALGFGAEGVGLYRTEYLFLNRQSVPSEDEQYRDYRAVADVLGSRPLIIRTLDIGGDKQLPYLHVPQEMNPFLGWRAIRLCLDSPHIFEPQLRAILRAAVDRNVRIMFPMIATLEEVRQARQVLERVRQQLASEGVPFRPDVEVGIMVEIPSAAVMADLIAPEVDFFSIGTNDLIQYTLACDRINDKVAYLYDPLHPAVLRLIQGVITAAHGAGRRVGMCGEMAGDCEAIPLLLGMGLDEFSMNAAGIPQAKALIGSLSMAQAKAICSNAMARRTADEVREYLRSLGLARR
jgi:phosphotransferase system enzyme I (PtsI)